MTRPLRGVCFVVPEIERIGGYELATLALVRDLKARDVPVLVVTTTTGRANAAGETDVIRIKVQGRRTLLHIFPRLIAVLARERSKYSIIHCPTFSHLSGLAVLAGRILRRPTLLRVASENDVREFVDARSIKLRLFFHLLRSAAGIIAPSMTIRDKLLGAGFHPDCVFYVPNGVDVARFQPATPFEKAEAKNVFGLSEETAVIGTVARLVPGKGIETLLRAFQILIRKHRAHLLVVGDGPLGNELCKLARDLGINRSVSWLGLQADTSKWLRAMEVFAFPSWSEGSPNVVLEAMATGLPIVATTIGGVVDLLKEGEAGYLVPPDNSDALAEALGCLLRDGSLRSGLGYRARTRAVEGFSLADHISRLVDLYLALQDCKLRPRVHSIL